MPVFSVVEDLCRADGICSKVCPVNVIKGPVGHVPVMRPDSERNCIACGHCMAFCPHGAARVDALPLEEMLPLDKKALPDAEVLEMLFRTRRSIRQFKKDPVSRGLLERILLAARHAPSAKNERPVRWIMVYEREKMKAIGNSMAEWMEALSGEKDGENTFPQAREHARAWRQGLDPFFRGAPHLLLAVTPKSWAWGGIDAAISLTYVELAAMAHSVGACWAGYVTIAAHGHGALRQLLGVAEDESVSGGQMLGYIGLHPTASAPRAPFPLQWL